MKAEYWAEQLRGAMSIASKPRKRWENGSLGFVGQWGWKIQRIGGLLNTVWMFWDEQFCPREFFALLLVLKDQINTRLPVSFVQLLFFARFPCSRDFRQYLHRHKLYNILYTAFTMRASTCCTFFPWQALRKCCRRLEAWVSFDLAWAVCTINMVYFCKTISIAPTMWSRFRCVNN